MSAKELADSIQLEAEHHIPFAIDDVYMDYQIIGGGGDGGMDVVLAVVKKAKVNEYLSVIQEADLTPVVVDVDAFAIEKRGATQTMDIRLCHIWSLPEVVEHLDLSMRGSQMLLEGTRDLLDRPLATSGHEQQ